MSPLNVARSRFLGLLFPFKNGGSLNGVLVASFHVFITQDLFHKLTALGKMWDLLELYSS